MYTLSNELTLVLSSSPDSIKNIYFENYEDRYYAIVLLLRKAFLDGKSSLVIVPNEDLKKIGEIIADTDISELVTNTSNQKLIEKNKEYRNKKWIISLEDKKEITFLKYKNEKLKLNLNNYYYEINQSIFGDKSYKQIYELALNSSTYFSPEFIGSRINSKIFEFDYKEFWEIKQELEESILLFKPEYRGLDQINMFSEVASFLVVEKSDLNNIINILIDYKRSAESLITEFYQYISDFKKIKKDTIRINSYNFFSSYNELHDLINIDKLELYQLSNEKAYILFGGSNKNLRRYNDLWSDLVEQCKIQELLNPKMLAEFNEAYTNVEDIESAMVIMKNYIEAKLNNLDKEIDVQLRRINCQNTESEIPLRMEKQFNQLIKRLNDSSLWKIKWENNSLSIFQQLKYLEKIHKHLLTSEHFLNVNPEFLFWDSFYQQLSPQAKTVIKSLLNNSKKDWINAFISWYLNSVVNKQNIDHNLSSELDLYRSNQETLQKLEIQDLKEVLNKEPEELLKYQKRSYNKYLDESIKNNHTIDSMFSIKIMRYEEVKDMQDFSFSDWDYVHVCMPDHLSIPELSLRYDPRNIVLQYSKQGEANHNDLRILYDYKPTITYTEMTSSQQLEPAKLLARQLFDIYSGVKTYVWEKKYIVSLVNDNKLELYFENLKSLDLKSYNISGNSVDNLTDIILANTEDFKLLLIIEDGLLNSSTSADLDWQLKIIDDFIKAGFEVLNQSSFKGLIISDKTKLSHITNTKVKEIENVSN